MMNLDTFYAPETIQQLVDLLKLKSDRSDLYFVAGGTDFLIDIKKRGIMDFTAIDLTHLNALKEIEKKDNCIEIGAAVTMSRIEKSDIVRNYAHAIAEAAGRVGSTQIRNRATIGGNIANASHCADTVTSSFAYGAAAVLVNSEGAYRELLLEEFIVGLGRTQIKQDEVLVKLRIPYENDTVYSSFSKVGSRKRVAISKLNHAARLVFKGNHIAEASIYFGSIGPKAIKAINMEKHCIGREWNEALRAELMELGAAQVDEAIPGRASRVYKRTAVKGVISDVFDDIANQRGKI